MGSLILPAVVLGMVSFAYVLRLTRASVIENMNADYVRTATAKGLSRRQVVTTHVLRNSLIPVITYLGASLGGLMGGAIVTEAIFNVPGVGQKLYQAIIRSEGPTVVAIVSVLVLVFVLANLLVDLLYAWLDPRIRYEKLTTTSEHFVAPVEETPLLATDAVKADDAPLSLWADAWRKLRRRPLFIISAVMIALIYRRGALPRALHPGAPDNGCELAELQRRSHRRAPARLHLPGLRHLLPHHPRHPGLADGRCVFRDLRADHRRHLRRPGRLLRRLGGTFFARLGDIFFALPIVLGALVLTQLPFMRENRGVGTVVLVLVVLGWPQMARITRGAVIEVRNADFVTAARSLGVSRVGVPVSHVLPNALARSSCSPPWNSASSSSPKPRSRSSASACPAT